MTAITPEQRTELMYHARGLHAALLELGASSLPVATPADPVFDGMPDWGPFDLVQRALLQVLATLTGSWDRARQAQSVWGQHRDLTAAEVLEEVAGAHQRHLDAVHAEAVTYLYDLAARDRAARETIRELNAGVYPVTTAEEWGVGVADLQAIRLDELKVELGISRGDASVDKPDATSTDGG